MKPAVVAIIQARMASSRLPGKVLLDIGGAGMLGQVFHRTRLAAELTETVVATSVEVADDAIEDYCHQQHIPCYRGSHFDVLDRYYTTARRVDAEIVVRITADCPLIDPSLIDATVRALATGRDPRFDFAATRLPPPWKRTHPIGLDVEACTIDALERAWKEAHQPEDREHVMPFMYKGVALEAKQPLRREGTSSSGMRIAILDCDEDLGSQRWTVDTQEDLEFVRQIFTAFLGRRDFSWLEVRQLLRGRPELLEINARVHHKGLEETDPRSGAGGAS